MAIVAPSSILAGSASNFANNTACTPTTSAAVAAGTLVLVAASSSTANTTLLTLKDSAGNTYSGITPAANANCWGGGFWWAIIPVALPVGSTFTGTTSGAGTWFESGAWTV